MPRYLYECQTCGFRGDVTHSITVKYQTCADISGDCEDGEGELVRVPSFSSALKHRPRERDQKTGEVTNDFIETAQDELKEQKKNLRGQEYK